MAAEKESAAKVDLGLLEEDDEFEEFPADGGCHYGKLRTTTRFDEFVLELRGGQIIKKPLLKSSLEWDGISVLMACHAISTHAYNIHFDDSSFSQTLSQRVWRTQP